MSLNSTMYRQNYWQPKNSAFQLVNYNEAFQLFKQLNTDELKEMLNEEEKIEEVLKDLEMVKKWENEKEMLLASNKSLAEFTLAEEPRLTEGRQKLCQLHTEANDLLESLKEKNQQLNSLSGNHSLETLLALLQTATAESEEESENLAEKLLNAEIDLEEFLELYLNLRTVVHSRRIKADKLKDIITNKTSTTSGITSNNWTNAQVPYPVGPVPGPLSTPYPPYAQY